MVRILVGKAHNPGLQGAYQLQAGLELGPGRRRDLQRETAGPRNGAAGNDLGSPATDVQSYAEVEEVFTAFVHTPHEERNCQGQPLPMTAFDPNGSPPSLRAHTPLDCLHMLGQIP